MVWQSSPFRLHLGKGFCRQVGSKHRIGDHPHKMTLKNDCCALGCKNIWFAHPQHTRKSRKRQHHAKSGSNVHTSKHVEDTSSWCITFYAPAIPPASSSMLLFVQAQEWTNLSHHLVHCIHNSACSYDEGQPCGRHCVMGNPHFPLHQAY